MRPEAERKEVLPHEAGRDRVAAGQAITEEALQEGLQLGVVIGDPSQEA
jgi:hypothetical protein